MDYTKFAVPKEKNRHFPPIPDVKWVLIDEATGMIATDGRRMPMIEGTEPTNLAGSVGQKTTDDLLINDF